MNNTEGRDLLQWINRKQYTLEAPHDVVWDILSRDEHQSLLNGVGEFRARTYTPLKTLHTSIHQVLSSDKSGTNAVAGLNVGRLLLEKKPVCPNSGSYTKAKKRLPEEMIHQCVTCVNDSLLKRVPLEWKPYGREVKVCDGTILTLQDTPLNNEQYPKHSNQHRAVGFPQIRLLVVVSLSTGSVVDYA